jgi:hypothetical protein
MIVCIRPKKSNPMVKRTCKSYKLINTKSTWVQMGLAFITAWLITGINHIELNPCDWSNWKKPMVLVITLVAYPYMKKNAKKILRAMERYKNNRTKQKIFKANNANKNI